MDRVIWNTPGEEDAAVHTLRQRGYQPQPAAAGLHPQEQREAAPLGIPTMTDRAMQTLYLLALDPVAETTADPNSYGFRARAVSRRRDGANASRPGPTQLGPVGARRRHPRVLRSRMLILPSKSQCGERAILELAELVERGRRIGEQKGLALRVFGHLDGAVVDPVVDPVRRELQRLGESGARSGSRRRGAGAIGCRLRNRRWRRRMMRTVLGSTVACFGASDSPCCRQLRGDLLVGYAAVRSPRR